MRLAWPGVARRGPSASSAEDVAAPAATTPKRPSLVRRLVILAAAWSLGVLAVAGVALAALFSQLASARFDDTLDPVVDILLAGASGAGGRLTVTAPADPRFQPAFGGYYWEMMTADAAPPPQMLRSRSLWDHVISLSPDNLAALANAPGDVLFFNDDGPLGQPLRVAAMQARLEGLSPPVIVMAAADRSPVERDVRTFDTSIGVALLLLAAGLIAAVVVQVRVGLRPLFALRREVTAVRTGRSERILGDYPSELEPLAAELNVLMTHTHEIVERQRTHVGNLAHALKTPLSVMMTEAAQQGGPLAEVVMRQATTMGQHVDHHLRRATAAARTQGQGESTPVAPVIEDLSRTLEKIFRDKLDEVEWDCPEDVSFRGERQDLLEIAGNVTENGCKWCRARVRVTARAVGDHHFELVVEDDGPGLPSEKRGEVLRRGARLDEHTPGSGLGLAIVDELARAYGGSIALGDSKLGGLQVTIVLPRAEQ